MDSQMAMYAYFQDDFAVQPVASKRAPAAPKPAAKPAAPKPAAKPAPQPPRRPAAARPAPVKTSLLDRLLGRKKH